MRFIGWCGRATAWVVCWPAGLALSIRRGVRKRHAETIAELRRR